MKLGIFALLYLALVVIISAGCASLLRSPNDPQLGEYSYTHRPAYDGPPKRVVHIWVDKNFSNADLQSIESAVETWNMSLNGYIKLVIVDVSFDMEVDKIVEQVKVNGWLFMKIDSSNPIIPTPNVPGNRTIGFCERIGGNHLYIVRDRIYQWDVYGITMHEMGHLLGSEHIGNRLMYPTYAQARFQCVDFDSLKAVAKYQEIPIERLNYCVDKGEPIPVEVDAGDKKKVDLEL